MPRFLAAVTCSVLLLAQTALATAPALEQPLPPLQIAERGEMRLEGENVKFGPWSSEKAVGKVHVVQYFGGSMSASKIYEPFTDALQEHFELGSYHVTTIINLDDAMWGTTGLVISEGKKSKQKFPLSTMVLDAKGDGKRAWQLGKHGAGLFILDPSGSVQYIALKALNEEEIEAAVALVGRYI